MNHGKRKAVGCLVLVVAVFVCSTRAQHSTGDSPSQSEILPTKFGKAVDRDVTEVRAGALTLYVQNAEAGAPSAQPGDQVTLSWSPDATFVVESQEE